MPIIAAQVSLYPDSGLPEDVCTNTWHFLGSQANAEATIPGALDEFYNEYQGAGGALGRVCDLIGASITPASCRLKLYNLTDAKPRVPFYDELFPLDATSGTQMPREVALCLSYRGPQVSGAAMARRRGRIYIGPLTDNDTDFPLTGNDRRPSSNVRDLLTTAAASMQDAATVGSVDWVVYSPTANPSGSGETGVVNVVNVWVDNALDTQRRRGAAPTTRTSLDV